MALVAAAGAANAQVEFRIIERNGQSVIPNPPTANSANSTTDSRLNYAVQARVNGGPAGAVLANFAFTLRATGELDAYGAPPSGGPFLLATSLTNGTYDPNANQSTSQANGTTGMAAQYRYLIGVNPSFAGLVNTSGGTFTNTPNNQEIGLITGANIGSALLQQTDFGGGGPTGDDPDGNPDSYTGSGTTAPIPAAYANTYLGGNGNWIDIYRFTYITSNATLTRDIVWSLADLQAQYGTQFVLSNGVWGTDTINATVTQAPNTVHVVGIPAPASAALLGLGGLVASRRRRTA